MSLNLARVQETLYHWVRTVSEGVIEEDRIIWRNQSEPLPPRPCITMKIVDGPRPVGMQDNLTYINGGNFNIGGQREMGVSIQVFGNTKIHRPMAYQLGLDLTSSLSKLTVLDMLRGGGIAVQSRGELTNITALEETEYEERAQFDLLLGLAQNVVDDPGIIEQAVITDNVSGP